MTHDASDRQRGKAAVASKVAVGLQPETHALPLMPQIQLPVPIAHHHHLSGHYKYDHVLPLHMLHITSSEWCSVLTFFQ